MPPAAARRLSRSRWRLEKLKSWHRIWDTRTRPLPKTPSMLQLDFKDAASDHSASLGPAQTFKFSRSVVCDESRGHVLATYRSDQWEIEGSLYPGFKFSRPSRIYFEDATGRRSYGCGPFAGIVVTRGALHIGHQLFAHYQNRTQLWHCYALSSDWPVMVLKATTAAEAYAAA